MILKSSVIFKQYMSKFGAYLKTKHFRNTLLMAIGSVILIVLVIFSSLNFYTNHGSGVPVPKLKGLNIDNAIDILKNQGFVPEVDSVFRNDIDPGTVVEQDPDPGTNVKEGRKIYLTMVSKLAPNVSLPNIEQMPYITAESMLANNGLRIGDTTYSADIARDMVLEVRFSGQPIKAGTKIPKGSRLDLVLGDGKGAAEIDIPDLVGVDYDAVKFQLKGQGLLLGTVTKLPGTDTTNAWVVAQQPMKTDSVTKMPNGTRINITIGNHK